LHREINLPYLKSSLNLSFRAKAMLFCQNKSKVSLESSISKSLITPPTLSKLKAFLLTPLREK